MIYKRIIVSHVVDDYLPIIEVSAVSLFSALLTCIYEISFLDRNIYKSKEANTNYKQTKHDYNLITCQANMANKAKENQQTQQLQIIMPNTKQDGNVQRTEHQRSEYIII